MSVRRTCRDHTYFVSGCEPCQVAVRAYRRSRLDRTMPVVVKGLCICGCGKPVGNSFRSYATTECMFRGRKR